MLKLKKRYQLTTKLGIPQLTTPPTPLRFINNVITMLIFLDGSLPQFAERPKLSKFPIFREIREVWEYREIQVSARNLLTML